ncbi:MAG: DNA polymerase III subunit chi [Alphaproteobacteria bacterium]|nr:DNA polymerase III subunit chi [Alphaproteobacteria bacterium]
MTEIRFYHLQRQNEHQVLPSLLSKALSNGHKIIVKCANDAEKEKLNEYLWTYNPDSFLPHGSNKDGNEKMQPIWLTAKDENPNGADVLIISQGAQAENMDDFTLCCEMLDGQDEDAVKDARTRWKTYKEQGFEVTYWQQSDQGSWEKKA